LNKAKFVYRNSRRTAANCALGSVAEDLPRVNMTINLWVKVTVFSADRPKWTGLITANAKEGLHSCTCQKKKKKRKKKVTQKRRN